MGSSVVVSQWTNWRFIVPRSLVSIYRSRRDARGEPEIRTSRAASRARGSRLFIRLRYLAPEWEDTMIHYKLQKFVVFQNFRMWTSLVIHGQHACLNVAPKWHIAVSSHIHCQHIEAQKDGYSWRAVTPSLAAQVKWQRQVLLRTFPFDPVSVSSTSANVFWIKFGSEAVTFAQFSIR